MKLNDSEFYNILNQFKSDFKNLNISLEKNKNLNKIQVFFENGETNKMFKAYLLGYSLSKSINNL
jgi:hypothetical protein